MLLDTRTPLKQVALDCGFANANYFSKVFRRFQHIEPCRLSAIPRLTSEGASRRRFAPQPARSLRRLEREQ